MATAARPVRTRRERTVLAAATLVGVQAPLLAGVVARGAGLDRYGPGWYLVGAAATAFAVIGVATLVIVPPRPRR